MSYSRWVNSKFYTYWASKGGVENKKDEMFLVHHDLVAYRGFTYSECKKMIGDI